jgi:hypothetical protein
MRIADLDCDIASIASWEHVPLDCSGGFRGFPFGSVEVRKVKSLIIGDEFRPFTAVKVKARHGTTLLPPLA